MTATYARCTEPTGSNAREGCGWTGEVERVDETCGLCGGSGRGRPIIVISQFLRCGRCGGTGKVTHDGDGRWPWDISRCPNCNGTIEVDK